MTILREKSVLLSLKKNSPSSFPFPLFLRSFWTKKKFEIRAKREEIRFFRSFFPPSFSRLGSRSNLSHHLNVFSSSSPVVSQKEEDEECLERLLRRAHDVTTTKRERERERTSSSSSSKARSVFLSPLFKTTLRKTRPKEQRKKKRTDANNAAVVAAVTAALESFSDKLDAWTTVLLTELLCCFDDDEEH